MIIFLLVEEPKETDIFFSSAKEFLDKNQDLLKASDKLKLKLADIVEAAALLTDEPTSSSTDS